MKKTFIALVVAASAAVSVSAMAAGWEQNGSGGSVDMSGTLTPVEKVTPWEVKVGDAVTGLDAQIQKDQSVGKRLVRTVLIFTESSDQLSRATDRVPGLPASPGYVQ
ncbi:hypothetical protein ACXAQL_004570 [Escherichia coli]|uniref:F4 family fimbrial subunit n=1 Tax=Salmonella enterica TaxID=28901 RepID=UPI0009AA2118